MRFKVFNVKEGWKPLCDFLGVPVPSPNVPFPKFNDTKTFNQMMKRLRLFGAALIYGLPVTIAVLGFIFRDSIIRYLPS